MFAYVFLDKSNIYFLLKKSYIGEKRREEYANDKGH